MEVRNPLSSLVHARSQGVTVTEINYAQGETLATLDQHHYLLAPMFRQIEGTPNVALIPKLCHCGKLHLQVISVRPIFSGTSLIVELLPHKATHLVAQFDSSCYVKEQIGGAVGVIWAPGPIPRVLDTIAEPLQPCSDSMYADAHAAEVTLRRLLKMAETLQLKEVVLQGDCMNIVKNFAGAVRLHRVDLVRKLESIWKLIAHSQVAVQWSYIPEQAIRSLTIWLALRQTVFESKPRNCKRSSLTLMMGKPT